MNWNHEQGIKHIYNFTTFPHQTQEAILTALSQRITVKEFTTQVQKRLQALKNRDASRSILTNSQQQFPSVVTATSLATSKNNLKNMALIITAGGEGERLRLSLLDKGYSQEDLADFTKATFPIPQTPFTGGALEVNLLVIAALAQEINYDIPVVITTGPTDSITARVIPQLLKDNNNFGLKSIRIINQDERFHLTNENQIVVTNTQDTIAFATNPDESGGPLAKLAQEDAKGVSTISWLKERSVTKALILQGTAVYQPSLIPQLATAAQQYAVAGVGIARSSFVEDDPYGTFVTVINEEGAKLFIAEKDVRTPQTISLYDTATQSYLPFNTGFYAIDIDLLNQPFPDYASPNKQLPSPLAPAPKVGYAATDILSFSENCGVVTIAPDSFKVIKNADDIVALKSTITQFNLTQYHQ